MIDPLPPAVSTKLTPKQRAVVIQVLLGRSEAQIADHLRLNHHTVHGRIKTIYKTLSVTSRPALIVKVCREVSNLIEQQIVGRSPPVRARPNGGTGSAVKRQLALDETGCTVSSTAQIAVSA